MLLQTDKLSKDYNGFRALDALDLAVGPGEIFGLLGPNGSGKTTALRLIMGFLRPTSGRASIDGHDCWHDGVAARRHASYLPGELRLYENMTGRRLVRFLGNLRGHALYDVVDDLARRFEIDLDRPLAALSSGMKRKVALLQVLTARTPLVIMDEPTNALDPTMRDELLEQVRQARDRGQAVLFSSHVLAEVDQVCDRVGILRAGRLVHVQDMHTLRAGRILRARFLRPPGAPPALDGLSIQEQTPDTLMLEHTGDLAPLLGWLSRKELADLRVQPLGLASVYQRFHGAEK